MTGFNLENTLWVRDEHPISTRDRQRSQDYAEKAMARRGWHPAFHGPVEIDQRHRTKPGFEETTYLAIVPKDEQKKVGKL